mgnify:CR=1 FL=1
MPYRAPVPDIRFLFDHVDQFLEPDKVVDLGGHGDMRTLVVRTIVGNLL